MRISDWSSGVCSSDLQVDRHARAGGAVVGKVKTRAAIQNIRPRAADEQVVAGGAFKSVRSSRYGKHIAKGRAHHTLHTGKPVALRRAAKAGTGGKVDGDRRAGA